MDVAVNTAVCSRPPSSGVTPAWRQIRSRRDSQPLPRLQAALQVPVDRALGHPPTLRVGLSMVEELNLIPGAREALVNYLLLLQEWSSRAEQGGPGPRD